MCSRKENKMKELKNKTALVTGGSRGIGREISLSLAKSGVNVAVVYTSNKNSALSVKHEIEAIGAECTLIEVDLCQENCAEVIFKQLPQADILVHNASVQIRNNWENISLDEFETQMNCNLRSVLLINQKYISYMKKNKWGRIITIGSVQERKPNPAMLVYSSSKCALTAMARAMAPELAPFNITVNSVAPGIILTDRNSDVLSDKEYYKACLNKVPAGRFGETSDISGIVKFLCSNESSYITGQNIFVDGGMGL